MTPNFALSLSFDGIALLQQVPDGWHLVGEVPLETADLPAALSVLRDQALALDPSGLRTKLVIPSDQIRYMTLQGEDTTADDVHHALDGETPYALNELVIDTVRANGSTYIAAVAQETLVEATAFATDNLFNPVACAALPEPGTFDAEVFFLLAVFFLRIGNQPSVLNQSFEALLFFGWVSSSAISPNVVSKLCNKCCANNSFALPCFVILRTLITRAAAICS